MSSMHKVTTAAQQEDNGHKQRQSLQQSVTEAMQRYFSDLGRQPETSTASLWPRSSHHC